MAIKYLAGERLIGTAAERAALPSSSIKYTYTAGADQSINSYGSRIVGGGIFITGSRHDLVGETINKVTFKLSNNSGSPDGVIYAIVSDHHASSWQGTNASALTWLSESYVFNTTVDATTLTSTATDYTFGDGTDAGYQISNGDTIFIYYGDGSNNSAANAIKIYEDSTDTSDNYGQVAYTGLNQPTAWERTDGITTYMIASFSAPPNLPNGAIFEEQDTGKHYMFDGTSAWNEVV